VRSAYAVNADHGGWFVLFGYQLTGYLGSA
jgi:hypothetical protein